MSAVGPTPPASTTSTPAAPPNGPGSLPIYSVVLAFVLVIAFLGLTCWMFGQRSVVELQWDRGMQLYSTIEAFALSAAGALLGVTIQSGRVKAAEAQANANGVAAAQAQAQVQKVRSDLGGYQRVVSGVRGVLGVSAIAGASGDRGGGQPTAIDVDRVLALLATLD